MSAVHMHRHLVELSSVVGFVPIYVPVQELLGQEEDCHNGLAALSCPPLWMATFCCGAVQGSLVPIASTMSPQSSQREVYFDTIRLS